MPLRTLYLCWPTPPRQFMQLPTLPPAAATIVSEERSPPFLKIHDDKPCLFSLCPSSHPQGSSHLFPRVMRSSLLSLVRPFSPPIGLTAQVHFCLLSQRPGTHPWRSPHPAVSVLCGVAPEPKRKKERSVTSVLFFKTPTFCSLLVISYSLWFFKKYRIMIFCRLIAEFLALPHITHQSKCLARLTLGPALSCSPPLLPRCIRDEGFQCRDPPGSNPQLPAGKYTVGVCCHGESSCHLRVWGIWSPSRTKACVLCSSLSSIRCMPQKKLGAPESVRAGQWWEPQVRHPDAITPMLA